MKSLLIATTALVVVSGSALAEEFQYAPDDSPVYLRVSPGVTFLALPEVEGFGGSIDDLPFNFLRQPDEDYRMKAAGFGGALTLGLDLEEVGLPLLGAARLEASVHGYSVRDNDSHAYSLGPDEYYDVIAVDGLGAAMTYDGAGVFQIEAEAQEIAGDLMLYWDALPGAGGFSFGAGLTGGHSAVTYRYGVTEDLTTTRARANFVGPQVAIDFALPVAERTTLYLGAKVAGLWMDGDLHARQDSGGDLEAQTADSENWLAAKGTLSVGLEFDLWGAAVAKVGAEGSYLTAAPQVVNAKAGPGMDVNASVFEPTHLDQAGAWSGQLMLSVSFALGGF